MLAEKAGEAEPIVPFPAQFGEAPVIVTAILDRTAVVASTTDSYDRNTLTFDRVMVDPVMVEWKPSVGARTSMNGQVKPTSRWNSASGIQPKNEADRKAARAAGDARALESQAAAVKRDKAEVVASRKAKPAQLYLNGKPLILDASAQAKAEELLAKQGIELAAPVAALPVATVPFRKNAGPDPRDRRAWSAEKKQLAETGQRRCSNCRLVKALDEFPQAKGRCAPCWRTYQSDWAHNRVLEKIAETGNATKTETTQEAAAVSPQAVTDPDAKKQAGGQGNRVAPAIVKQLAERGLKRCPKCKRDRPIDEFNSAGYCSCRFVNGETATAATERNLHRTLEVGPIDLGLPSIPAETPTRSTVLEQIRQLRRERDEARSERDAAKAELDALVNDLGEVLAGA
jgi:hypothetical protein